MKRSLKRTMLMLVVVMMLVMSTTVTAFAEDATATGSGDVTSTVPIEGTIDALNISITHPAIIAYSINPNADVNFEFVAPNIAITNNTKAPVNVTVQSLESVAGGTIQFADVNPTDRDWANLNVSDSKEFLALGIKIDDSLGWNTGYFESIHYAFVADATTFGSLSANATGLMKLTAKHGLAFDQTYTAKHSLILMFNLV
jgi:hypothetical protein